MARIQRSTGTNIQVDKNLKVESLLELPLKNTFPSTDLAGSIGLKSNNKISYKDNLGNIIELDAGGSTIASGSGVHIAAGAVNLGLNLLNGEGLSVGDTLIATGDLATTYSQIAFNAREVAIGKTILSSVQKQQRLWFSPAADGDRIRLIDAHNMFGFEYAQNYATNGKLNDRWIPDWAAVKSLNNLQSVTDGFSNNTTTNNLVVLTTPQTDPDDPDNYGSDYALMYAGGAYFSKKDTRATIGNNTIGLNVYGNSGAIQFESVFQNNVGGLKYYVNQTTGVLEMQMGVGYDVSNYGRYLKFESDVLQSNKFYDEYSSKGLSYAANYAVNGILDDRWIPDYGAVKALVAGGAAGNLQEVLTAGNVANKPINLTSVTVNAPAVAGLQIYFQNGDGSGTATVEARETAVSDGVARMTLNGTSTTGEIAFVIESTADVYVPLQLVDPTLNGGSMAIMGRTKGVAAVLSNEFVIKSQLDSAITSAGAIKVYPNMLVSNVYTRPGGALMPTTFELQLTGQGLLRQTLDYTKSSTGFTLLTHVVLSPIDFILIIPTYDPTPQAMPTTQKITMNYGDIVTYPGLTPATAGSNVKVRLNGVLIHTIGLNEAPFVYNRAVTDIEVPLTFTFEYVTAMPGIDILVNGASPITVDHLTNGQTYTLEQPWSYADKKIEFKTQGSA